MKVNLIIVTDKTHANLFNRKSCYIYPWEQDELDALLLENSDTIRNSS